MNFQQAVATCLRSRYADFKGRAGPAEFWWFFLFQVLVLLIAGMLGEVVYGVAALLLILPGLAVGARRLHDSGKSAWFLLLGFIPLLGFLVLVYFWVQPSAGPNPWGPAPGSSATPALPPTQP